jgi:tripartite-type tricarboxylate transporter receptor subunit TctC
MTRCSSWAMLRSSIYASALRGPRRHSAASLVYGVGAPRNTPAEIIEKLNNEINAALADPKIKARLADMDGMVLALSPADFGKLIPADVGRLGG